MKRSAKEKISVCLQLMIGDMWVDNSPYVGYGSPCTMLFVGTCVSPLAYDEPCWEVIKTDSKGNTTFCRYESFTVLDWYKEVFKYGKEFFLVR